MLASETQEISNYLRNVYFNRFGAENLKERFADTRDTLCYATNDNQTAVIEALKTKPDISIVIGGYNSSNTTGLARICSQYSKTYYISNPEKIINNNSIYSFDIEEKKEKIFDNFLSDFYNPKILIVTGASCPDILVELTIKKILNLYNIEEELESLYDKIEEII
jgi:4-hydroxy-3-methylbut-2-enyl diphosphate reductase